MSNNHSPVYVKGNSRTYIADLLLTLTVIMKIDLTNLIINTITVASFLYIPDLFL